MSDKLITVLMIEDNPGDARLIREILEDEISNRLRLEHVSRLDAALGRLSEGGIDVALLDLSLPDSQGIDTFNQVRAHAPQVPIVVLTGLADEAVAAETLRAGGQDYLNKRVLDLCVLHRSIQNAVDRARSQEMSCRAQESVAGVDGVMDQFLAVIGHELRTPLIPVLSTVSALMDEPTTAAGHLPDLAMIRRHLELEARLIDDLVAYSRIVPGGAAFQRTDCQALVERALAELKQSIYETSAVVTHGPLPSLWADPGQLQQVFQHLIATAIRYRGDAVPFIRIGAVQRDHEWVFSFCDNGIGFDPKLAERIFIIFQRLHDNDEYPGTGLGLAICKKIVERHGGRIWAESEPGRGSRFSIAIPATGADEP